MQVIDVLAAFESIKLWGDRLYQGPDQYIFASCPLPQVKYLFFFDSRGISGEWETSLLKSILSYVKEDYLIVARPLELTTWATLYNFLNLNSLSFERIITNIGIVDYTPKKKILCENMMAQVKFKDELPACMIYELEEYHFSNGDKDSLFSVEYDDYYIEKMRAFFASLPLVSIKTPIVSGAISIQRKRPASFFKQIYKTNQLIDLLEITSIDLGIFDNHLTYDAVHWTSKGNEYIFEKLKKYLKQ